MDEEKKPKCYGCGNKGNEEFYIWCTNHGKNGHLWHFSCWYKVGTLISKAMERAIKDVEKNYKENNK